MLEKCPKIGVRSYANDNQTDISNIRTSDPGNLLVPGFFICKKRTLSFLLTFPPFFDTISSCRPPIGAILWEFFYTEIKEGFMDE